MREIPNPPTWNRLTKRFYNPVTGMIKVVDSESGKTIFFYSDDPVILPVSVEKTEGAEWKVVFRETEK